MRETDVICWRHRDRWILHIADQSRTVAVATLADAATVVDRAYEQGRGFPAGDSWLRHIRGSTRLTALLADAAAIRVDNLVISEPAVAHRRSTARALADEGIPPGDIAYLLGVSRGRVRALLGGRWRPPTPVTDAASGTAAPPEVSLPADVLCPGGYVHEAYLYRGRAEFLAGTVAFVRAGVVLGQPVLVALIPSAQQVVRQALGADAAHVNFVDMAMVGANPARIIPGLRRFIDDHAGTGIPLRAIGEPAWAGRSTAEMSECHLHEALLNVAVEPDQPLWLRCLYDTERLHRSEIDETTRSHPLLTGAGGHRGSTSYGGAHHVEQLFARTLPEPPAQAKQIPFGPDAVSTVRDHAGSEAAAAGIDSRRRADLMVAVGQLASDVASAGGAGSMRIWREPDALVCEVTDPRHIADPMVGRRHPHPEDDWGRGVWTANQLCDLVQVRAGAHGTAVRVLTRL